MFYYYAYGLGIHSQIEIPEFISTPTESDLTIKIDSVASIGDYLPEEVIEQPWALKVDRKKALVYVKDTGVFSIENGCKIVFIPAPEATPQVTRFYLVGTVMAVLLYQREFLVLHGSVINFEGEAVVFLGNSGDGKSSTAAAFHKAGYNLVNDDVAPITIEDDRVILQPGFPQIKMSAATAKALGYDFESLPLIHPEEEKRGYRPQHNFLKSPLNVKKIYLLDYGEDFTVAPLSFATAVTELSRHSRPTTLYQAGDALHFFQCANLAKQQLIYRLQRPRNLQVLPKVVDFVANSINDKQLLMTQLS